MAAYPTPDPETLPTVVVNAATVADVQVYPGQGIEWTNATNNNISISVQAMNGVYPLNQNNFTVPASQGPVSAKQNNVLATTPAGTYPFNRGAALGNGKIVVKAGK